MEKKQKNKKVLQNGFKVEFSLIKKYFGKDWLEKQISFIQGGTWINNEESKKEEIKESGLFILEKIEELIKKFENFLGFDQWLKEARNSKGNFEDFFFELLTLENLVKESNNLTLKSKNEISGKVLEAEIVYNGDSYLIESTKLKKIPDSLENKVTFLFNKSTQKFRGNRGIHFVGVYDFFKYPEGNEEALPELHLLIKRIQQKFERGKGRFVLAFVITNIFINYNPYLKKTFIQKRYTLLKNPAYKKIPDSFFRDILVVDDFKII